MIASFPKKPAYNLGGYQDFKFMVLSQIESFPMIFNGKALTSVVLKPNQYLFEGYGTYESLVFSEKSEENVQGIFFEQLFAGFMPGDSQDHISLMEEMQRNYFILIAKDANGLMRLIGSPANPLSFKADFDSSGSRSGSRGYNFEFYAPSPFRAPLYV